MEGGMKGGVGVPIPWAAPGTRVRLLTKWGRGEVVETDGDTVVVAIDGVPPGPAQSFDVMEVEPDDLDGRRERHRWLAARGDPVAWNHQWGTSMTVDRGLWDRMTSLGFEAWHSGGGCMAWYRDAGAAYEIITDGEFGLGTWGRRDQATWNAGRYRQEDGEALDGGAKDVSLEDAVTHLEGGRPGSRA
jgi:hypothetical protein